MKKLIKGEISDIVHRLLYEDRKEDEELMINDIQIAINKQVISVNDMVEHFQNELIKGLSDD